MTSRDAPWATNPDNCALTMDTIHGGKYFMLDLTINGKTGLSGRAYVDTAPGQRVPTIEFHLDRGTPMELLETMGNGLELVRTVCHTYYRYLARMAGPGNQSVSIEHCLFVAAGQTTIEDVYLSKGNLGLGPTLSPEQADVTTLVSMLAPGLAVLERVQQAKFGLAAVCDVHHHEQINITLALGAQNLRSRGNILIIRRILYELGVCAASLQGAWGFQVTLQVAAPCEAAITALLEAEVTAVAAEGNLAVPSVGDWQFCVQTGVVVRERYELPSLPHCPSFVCLRSRLVVKMEVRAVTVPG